MEKNVGTHHNCRPIIIRSTIIEAIGILVLIIGTVLVIVYTKEGSCPENCIEKECHHFCNSNRGNCHPYECTCGMDDYGYCIGENKSTIITNHTGFKIGITFIVLGSVIMTIGICICCANFKSSPTPNQFQIESNQIQLNQIPYERVGNSISRDMTQNPLQSSIQQNAELGNTP